MESKLEFAISFPEEFYSGPLDGRILLMISDDDSDEPRFQISRDLNTQLIFGFDINGL
jgi:hypothetical protein